MYLYARLTELRDEARLVRDTKKVTLISTYLGEVENVLKNKPDVDKDGEVLKVLQKAYTDALTNAELLPQDDPRVDAYDDEAGFLISFLPHDKLPMSDAEAKMVAEDYMVSFPSGSLKDVMGYMGKLYAGRYNGKAVSQYVQKLLAERK